MSVTVLQLQFSPTAQRDTNALFVPGSDVQTWIREIARWSIEHGQLKLLIIPKSMSDLSPLGVLVFGEGVSECVKQASPIVIKFTATASRLFLPANSQLFPAVDEETIQKLLPLESYCVWHPTAGLTTFANEEVCSVADLFSSSPAEYVATDAAVPGTGFNQRLYSLTLFEPENQSPEDMLEQGKGDIGDKSNQIDQLKKGKEDNGPSTAGKAIGFIASPLAAIAKAMASLIPASDNNKRTWINGVEDWANQVLKNQRSHKQRKDFLELHRLQKMLEENPDEGLKYAMPLSSSVSNTVTSAGSWLSRRLVNFNLSGLSNRTGASGPGLPSDLHSKLMQQYRELAEREIRLGRYRRAAYIYGNLLNDLHAAARVLETGKHYREAATVFQRKLRQNDQAARCLKEGGLYSEAIELYESLGQFESAGDLYSELELIDNANQSWKTASEKFRKNGDLIESARIEEDKLLNDEAAVETLAASWPTSQQTAMCMKQLLTILGKTGQHERSQSWIAKFEKEAESSPSFLQIVELLSKTATTYPDQITRITAEDATLQLVSRSMTSGSENASQLLATVSALHPSDNLLRRDCNRFTPPLSVPKPSKTPTKPKARVKDVTLVDSHVLDGEYDWQNAVGIRGGYVLAGFKHRSDSGLNSEVIFKRLSSDFGKSSQVIRASYNVGSEHPEKILLITNSSRESVVVHRACDARFISYSFSAADGFDDVKKIKHLNLSEKVCAICEGSHNQWLSLRHHEGQWILDWIDLGGNLIRSRQIDQHEAYVGLPSSSPPALWCDGRNAWVAYGNTLNWVNEEAKFQEFDDVITGITGNVRATASRIALSFENGFRVIWPDGGEERSPLIAEEILSPELLFTRTGHLIVASGNQCEVYLTKRDKTERVGSVTIPKCRALFRTDDAAQFGVLDSKGQILIYQIPI